MAINYSPQRSKQTGVTFLEKAAPRFELGVKALQAPALPLGDAARLDVAMLPLYNRDYSLST